MRVIYSAIFVFAIGVIGFVSYLVAFDRFERSVAQSSSDRLSLYQAGLRSTLERVSHLPRIVKLHPNTREVLRQGKSIAGFNQYLKSVNDKASADALYVLDADGTTVAASNFDNEESFVGNNYRFRRYYTEAIRDGEATFFAVGVTTRRPGYFLSEVILSGDEVLGVAVVKVEFADLLQYWKEAREDVVITNADGVVVLASNSSRLYKTTRSIPQSRLEEMKASRKFANYELEPLQFYSANDEFDGRVTIDDADFLISSADTAGIGWRLHFLTPLSGVQGSALAASSVVVLLVGLAFIGLLYARARMERTKLQIVAAEAERVRQANVRLAQEVQERKLTEERLRDTQTELIQSSRLAALGKMSAAIVHEVNQPVSAIRTYTSSGNLLLNKRRIGEAKDVFGQIAKMTERLGAITSDLLVFSRKPVSEPRKVELNSVISEIVEECLVTVDPNLVHVELDLWKRELKVIGSEHRFEQLFSNLLNNAIQACENADPAKIVITSLVVANSAHIMISDNGHGISAEVLDSLFDPFFTTKGVGKGVGLGLALSYAIVDEAGGRIRCENREEGGARFIVELPLLDERVEHLRVAEIDD
ncbi:MAG: ATP-binding protein [Pseudomonadota bacterium]